MLPVWHTNIPNSNEHRFLTHTLSASIVLHVPICARHWKSLWFLLILLHPPSQSHPAMICATSTMKSGSSSATSRRVHLPPSSLHPPVLLPPFQSEPLVQQVVQVAMSPVLPYPLQAYKPQCWPPGPTLVHQAIPRASPQSRYWMVFQVVFYFS